MRRLFFYRDRQELFKYFFQGKHTILLRVDGRSYITTNIATIVNVLTHLAQIILILSGFDIIAVQFTYFIINLGQMLYLTWYVRKHYKWLNCMPIRITKLLVKVNL